MQVILSDKYLLTISFSPVSCAFKKVSKAKIKSWKKEQNTTSAFSENEHHCYGPDKQVLTKLNKAI